MADAEIRETPAPKPRRKSIIQAADTGSRKDLLVALQARLARAVQSPKTPPRDLASLTNRLLEVSRELEAIEAQEAKGVGIVSAPADSPFDPSTA